MNYGFINYSGISQVVNFFCQSIIFCFGLSVQIKNIREQNRERSKTWRIEISHAIVTTIYYGFRIPFQAITHFVPSLSGYVGSWLCYTASFVQFYGYHAIMAHTLWIAVEKYVLIVHTIKAREFGEKRIERIFHWISMMTPLTLSVIAMVTTDNTTRAGVKSCFGVTDENIN